MLNVLIAAIVLFSFVTAWCGGRMEEMCTRLLASPQKAVELTVAIGCSICFWSGIMETAQRAGILKTLSNFFAPLISVLFPKLKKDSAGAQAVCTNLAANLLGLGAASAPAGIRAVQEFQKDAPDKTIASDSSILMILLNTASLQLIPTTAAALRLQAGSAAPMEILPAVWMASALSIFTGVTAAKLVSLFYKNSPLERQTLRPNQQRRKTV